MPKTKRKTKSRVNALLTQSSKYVSLCISQSFALFQSDDLSQLFLKCQKKNLERIISTKSINYFGIYVTHLPTMLSLMSCWQRRKICCRLRMEVSDQERKALEQESTAASISSCVALGTRPTTSLVACRTGHGP